MKDTSPTPAIPEGPWTKRASYTNLKFWHIENERGVRIACCDDENVANLLAAASELLAAAERVLAYPTSVDAQDDLIIAVAKAKGR